MSSDPRTIDPSPPDKEAARILADRAQELARPLKEDDRPAPGEAVVVFRLARELYAIPQLHVREIGPLANLTEVPCVPRFVLGVFNLRGQILPVIDIKRFFDLPETGLDDMHVAVIVRIGDFEFGILADVVVDTRVILSTEVEQALPTLTGIRREYIKGVTADHVVILDLPAMVEDPNFLVNEEVTQ